MLNSPLTEKKGTFREREREGDIQQLIIKKKENFSLE